MIFMTMTLSQKAKIKLCFSNSIEGGKKVCNALSGIFLCKMVRITYDLMCKGINLSYVENAFTWNSPRQTNEALLYLQNVQCVFQVLASLRLLLNEK